MTRAEVARAADYPKGTALIKMLDALVKKGSVQAWYGVADKLPQAAWYYRSAYVWVSDDSSPHGGDWRLNTSGWEGADNGD
jgi:hypothetical protein